MLFQDGEMSGYGRYIFRDLAEFRGTFTNGCPANGFFLPPPDASDSRHIANYAQALTNADEC